MAENDKVFGGSIPELYDTHLVPLIFDSYAEDIAERINQCQPDTVLETAAGSGVVTRALSRKLAAGVRFVVTDLNQPMLDRAISQHPVVEGIEWQQADAVSLPFDDASFDAVVCQFGAMFFPDKVACYTEARRVLKPGGTLIFSVWDRIEENEFADVVTKAAAELFPDDPPMFLARTPHGYFDTGTIQQDVEAAGFASVVVSTIAKPSNATSARVPAVAYCEGTPLRNEIQTRGPGRLGEVTDQAELALKQQFGEGPITGKIQAHVVTAQR